MQNKIKQGRTWHVSLFTGCRPPFPTTKVNAGYGQVVVLTVRGTSCYNTHIIDQSFLKKFNSVRVLLAR